MVGVPGPKEADMLRRFLCVAVVVFLSAILSWPAAAQGTAASIIGRVTDQSGAVLPRRPW